MVIDFNGVAGRHDLHPVQRRAGAFPGGDPRNDYFTGDPDQTAIGGAPTTLAGHGPEHPDPHEDHGRLPAPGRVALQPG